MRHRRCIQAPLGFIHKWDIISFMEILPDTEKVLERQLGLRLRSLRQNRGWSLDVLAEISDVSRATVSRIENGDVSPTAGVLGRLCVAHGLTMSRLMSMVEDDFKPLVTRTDQLVWKDSSGKFTRRSVSPPATTLRAQVLDCELLAGASIEYERPARPNLEHHLLMLKGVLTMTVDGQCHQLKSGDCLRYQLSGATKFETPLNSGARYILVIV